jgi:hypothetical protein
MSASVFFLNDVFNEALPLPTHGRFLRISAAHFVASA